MQFNMFEAGAVDTPPKKPVNPSIGYPSNGNLSHGRAPTQLGAYWVYQLSEEFTALLRDNGIEPNPDDLHQLADFFGGYTREMKIIRSEAREVNAGGKQLLSDIRRAQSDFSSMKAGLQKKIDSVDDKLVRCENTLSQANSTLERTAAYSLEISGHKQRLETLKVEAQGLFNSHSTLAEKVGADLERMTTLRDAVRNDAEKAESARDAAQTVGKGLSKSLKEAQDTAARLKESLEATNSKIKTVESLVKEAGENAVVVSGYKDEAYETIAVVRSVAERVRSDKETVSTAASEVRRETQAAHSIVVEVNEAKTKVEALQAGFDEGIGRVAQAEKTMQEIRRVVESSASSAGGAMTAAQEASVLAETSRRKAEAAESRMLETVAGVERQAAQARQSGELARGYADDAGKYAAQARESARGVTWENLPDRPTLGKYATATSISYNELTELPDLSSLGSGKAVPRAGNRGFLSGYQIVETSTKSTLVIKKDSHDVQVWSGKGDFRLTCFPAGEDEYAVKVVHLKATGATALRLSGARWSDETPPDWGGSGETLTLTLCFIGGIVIAGVYSIGRTK